MSTTRPATIGRGKTLLMYCALLFVSNVSLAQQEGPPGRPPGGPPGQPQGGRTGAPLAGLTASQLKAFNEGAEEFREEETAEEGLGPIFNRNSCAACHSGPTIGGSSNINVTRFGRVTGGVFDPLASLGGSLLQERSITRDGQERIPQQANVTARRQTTPLFGLGLIEAIPDATILRGVRVRAVDGVLGKASLVNDVATGRQLVGRFGWKGQHATLLSFAGDAYLNEMGITNRLFPNENAPNGNTALLRRLDRVPDPEDEEDPDTGRAGVDALAGLHAIPRAAADSTDDSVHRVWREVLPGCRLRQLSHAHDDDRQQFGRGSQFEKRLPVFGLALARHGHSG